MKIDCEGCEFSILKRGFRYLKRIKKITMEYHNKFGDVDKLVDLLKKAKFSVIQIPTVGVPQIGHIYASLK